ncbi:MAG: hypothetical protein Q7R35_10715 [Elusimicrobiota bacterium]|nr:hypothetical protein [Elusimicrobiota bacterium]
MKIMKTIVGIAKSAAGVIKGCLCPLLVGFAFQGNVFAYKWVVDIRENDYDTGKYKFLLSKLICDNEKSWIVYDGFKRRDPASPSGGTEWVKREEEILGWKCRVVFSDGTRSASMVIEDVEKCVDKDGSGKGACGHCKSYATLIRPGVLSAIHLKMCFHKTSIPADDLLIWRSNFPDITEKLNQRFDITFVAAIEKEDYQKSAALLGEFKSVVSQAITDEDRKIAVEYNGGMDCTEPSFLRSSKYSHAFCAIKRAEDLLAYRIKETQEMKKRENWIYEENANNENLMVKYLSSDNYSKAEILRREWISFLKRNSSSLSPDLLLRLEKLKEGGRLDNERLMKDRKRYMHNKVNLEERYNRKCVSAKDPNEVNCAAIMDQVEKVTAMLDRTFVKTQELDASAGQSIQQAVAPASGGGSAVIVNTPVQPSHIVVDHRKTPTTSETADTVYSALGKKTPVEVKVASKLFEYFWGSKTVPEVISGK